MKTCTKCKVILDIENFNIRRASKDGLNASCKNCVKLYLNSEKGKETIKRKKNREKITKPWKKHHEKNKNDPDYIARIKKSQKKFASKESSKEYKRKYSKGPKYKLWRSNYRKLRNQTDPIFKLNSNMSKGIFKSLKYATFRKCRRHWENLVTFDRYKLREHLESKFQEGMSWENYGKWHVDHIRPVSSFNITSTECQDFKDCWALSNLQPLWAHDNLTKHAKWDESTSTTSIVI